MNVGDYVRTTYGIGKIGDAYVVYTDDGHIWRLCYTTDNPKIEIGIYTKKLGYDLFGEVQKDHSIKYEPLNIDTQKYFDMVYKEELREPVCYVPIENGIPRNAELFEDHKFIKSSPNIIDLIEVGDYVNRYYVEDIINVFDKEDPYTRICLANGCNYFQPDITDVKDIKSIVTKETYSSVEYRVENN